MKITFDWLKDHLDIKLNEGKLLEQLTNVGLEVESVENLSAGLDLFKVAKILKTEKHPNADRLKVCDVDVGEKEIKKVVCGAPNAREGLITIYAPPGAIIPKSKVKLAISSSVLSAALPFDAVVSHLHEFLPSSFLIIFRSAGCPSVRRPLLSPYTTE